MFNANLLHVWSETAFTNRPKKLQKKLMIKFDYFSSLDKKNENNKIET